MSLQLQVSIHSIEVILISEECIQICMKMRGKGAAVGAVDDGGSTQGVHLTGFARIRDRGNETKSLGHSRSRHLPASPKYSETNSSRTSLATLPLANFGRLSNAERAAEASSSSG